jgi:hypothetical protein
MRINSNQRQRLSHDATIYFNGEKEPNAVEVYIPGNVLEGEGYVVRAVQRNGKAVPIILMKEPLLPGQYESGGALCEKVGGHVRIEIAECDSEFND